MAMIPSEEPQVVEDDRFVGHVLHDGEYHIKRLLGQDASSKLYLAAHTTLATPLALKQVQADGALPESVVDELDYILHGGDISRRPFPGRDEQEVFFPVTGGTHTDLFLREALLMARLQHPALPTLYDYFSEDGYWYLVMNYVPGRTLRQQLQIETALSPLEALSYCMQVCDVLDYLHRQEPPLIYCALQPENIVLLPDKSSMLINLANARYFKEPPFFSEEEPGTHTRYTAPEFAPNGASIDIRADIYSLGMILQEMVLGTHPQASTEPREYPPMPVSTMLNGIIKLATQADPCERYQSAHVLFLALERAYRVEERLDYQRRLFGQSLQSDKIRVHAEQRSRQDGSAKEMGSGQHHNDETEVVFSTRDLEQRRADREMLQQIRRERLDHDQMEQQFASVDESLQRRSSMSLSQLSLHTLEGSPARRRRKPVQILTFQRAIQISFGLALMLFLVMASLLLYARLQPAKEHIQIGSTSVTSATHPQSGTMSNAWLRLPSLPRPEADTAAVYVEQRGHPYVYVNGAYSSPRHPSYDHALYRYDVTGTRWEVAQTAFPGMVNNAATVDERNTIYFTVGYSSDSYDVPSLLYTYQPETGQLKKIIPPDPISIGFASALFADQQGHLYLTQGFSHPGNSHAQAGTGWYRYDIATTHWQHLADLPVGLGYVVISSDEQGHLLLFGGSTDAGQQQQTNSIYSYDIAHNSWTQAATSLPQAISSASGCTIVPGKLALIGGFDKAQQRGKDSSWLIDTQTLQIQPLIPFTAGGSVLGASACDGHGHAFVVRGADDPQLPTQDFWQLQVHY
ncbi:protein kinase domain-containing protein [Dictyobacter aurantiacus]|uniref:Protein kinase domain-containing protein n=1 Tax=Dictyobacter aurantiacus TaxID=1936993 RepID=A0A401ZBY1_9CHLR|nr:protein kinase [Dictyobacter aurantiacus]GCE04359.1 hypothetical protein KDAU_16880 [Dictyobacter aurantiacus]